jgi:hypothetical protein
MTYWVGSEVEKITFPLLSPYVANKKERRFGALFENGLILLLYAVFP